MCVAILAGSKLAEINELKATIHEVCRIGEERHGFKLRVHMGSASLELTEFVKQLDAKTGRPIIYIVPSDVPWDASWVTSAFERLGMAAAKKTTPIRIIFVADIPRAWNWVLDRQREAVLSESKANLRVLEMTAGPLARSDIDLWLANNNHFGMTPDDVVDVTGGWPLLIRQLEKLRDSDRPLRGEQMTSRLLSMLDGHGLAEISTLSEAAGILRDMIECCETRINDEIVDAQMVAVNSGRDPERVSRVVAFGELTGLLSRGAHGLVVRREIRLALRQQV